MARSGSLIGIPKEWLLLSVFNESDVTEKQENRGGWSRRKEIDKMVLTTLSRSFLFGAGW